MKLRLVRLNPLTLEPGQFFVMCGRQLDVDPLTGVPFPMKFAQFPARLEYWQTEFTNESGVTRQLDMHEQSWQPVEFTNEFLSNEDNNAREVRPEVQVPVYNGPSRNKRGRSD